MTTDLIFGSIHLFCAGIFLPIIIFYLFTNPSISLIFYFVFCFNLLFGIYKINKVYMVSSQ